MAGVKMTSDIGTDVFLRHVMKPLVSALPGHAKEETRRREAATIRSIENDGVLIFFGLGWILWVRSDVGYL